MKRSLPALLAFCLIFFVLPGQMPDFLKVTPGQTQDAGEVLMGEIVKYRWTLENLSEDTLRIASLKTSSGAVAPYLESREILPKGKVVIGADFNTRGKGGPQKKTAALRLVGYEPVTYFYLEARILPLQGSLGIDEPIDLGEVSPGDTVSLKVSVPEAYLQPFTLQGSFPAEGNIAEAPELQLSSRKMIPGDSVSLQFVFGRENSLPDPPLDKQFASYFFKFGEEPQGSEEARGPREYFRVFWRMKP